MALSERDMRILAFERGWWRQPGAKEQAISDLLGLSATRYYQLLNELIDRPEALGFDPVLVKRLRQAAGPPPAHPLRPAGHRRHRPGMTGAGGPPGEPGLPTPRTAEGRAGLAAILADPGWALIAADFDGTLAPIVADPAAARAHPAATPALRALAGQVGTLAIITGRPALTAVELGGLRRHPGPDRARPLRLGAVAGRPACRPAVPTGCRHRPGRAARAAGRGGRRRWHLGRGQGPRAGRPHPPRRRPGGRTGQGRQPAGRAGQPDRAAAGAGAAGTGTPSPGTDKGTALTSLVAKRRCRAILFAGDDLGDLAAFAAVRDLRAAGHPGLTVCSGSAEVTELAAVADLVVDGPGQVTALLAALARAVSGSPRPAR